MVLDTARSLWAEPRVADPPARPRQDGALVALVALGAVGEGLLRPDVTWRALSVLVVVALAPTLAWRRTHPLAATATAFGTYAALQLLSLAVGAGWDGLNTGAFVLLLPYALVRWGSGRDAATGLAVVMVPVVLSATSVPADDVVAGGVVVLLSAAVGLAVRFRDRARVQATGAVKLREREQLARELHDTVAHHVTAIAVRAQAGRVLASSDPTAAAALAVIEAEASRTLAELRDMVGALRHGEEPDRSPARGVADIARLTAAGDGLPVEVALSGDPAGLRPSVDAALYRLAQESITNARRHARNATRVRVTVDAGTERVSLTVDDDGDPAPPDAGGRGGFGLVGMAERAKLLGGTFEAGPQGRRGWRVHAELPRGRGERAS